MSGTVPLASFGTQMFSPAAEFVLPNRMIAPLPYRFLFELWNVVSQDHAALHPRTAESIQAQLASIQNEIATINARLAAAGIP